MFKKNIYTYPLEDPRGDYDIVDCQFISIMLIVSSIVNVRKIGERYVRYTL